MTAGLVLVDSHPVFLLGLERLLAAAGEFRVLATCATAAETLPVVQRLRPDMVVLDLQLADGSGLRLLQELKAGSPSCAAVVLTAALDEDQTIDILGLGVEGIVLKTMPAEKVLECLRAVRRGEVWLEKQAVGKAVEKMLRREAGARRFAKSLTAREIEIARLVGEGLSNREISGKLAIQEGTVKIHLYRIFRKLEVESRESLALHVQKKGLV